MKKILILMVLIACGCTDKYIGEKKNKQSIEGERVPIIEVKENFSFEDYDSSIVLPKPVAVNEWLGSGGLSHHSLQHIASKAEYTLDYSKSIGTGNSYRNRLLAEPIVANGKIYTLDVNAKLSEFDFETGEKLWNERLEPIFSSQGHVLKGVGLSFSEGKIFVSLGSGEIQAINAENHEVLWRKMLPSPLRSAPLIYGGRVYALTADNKIEVLSAFSGENLWNNDFGSDGAMIMGVATPSADMGIVVLGLSVGEIVALRSDNGAFLWRATHSNAFSYGMLENMRDIKGRIIIDNDKVYVASNTKMTAHDLKDGTLLWEKDVASINNPVLAGDYLFIVSKENYLLTMLEKTGEVVAGIKLPMYEDEKDKTDRIFWTGPLLVEDNLIVAGTNGEIRLYSPYTGKLVKNVSQGESFSIPMIAVKDKIIFIDDDADLLVFK